MLDQKSLEKKVLKSISDKQLFKLKCRKDEIPVVSTQVTVKIMEIRWLLENRDDFLKFLLSSSLDRLAQTDFMRSLAHEYWPSHKRKILFGPLLSWTLYSVLCLFYFTEVLRQDSESDRNEFSP